jgi:hypothetical protein
LLIVRNITEGAKKKVEQINTIVEPQLVYPLLRNTEVRRWKTSPSVHNLVVQDPNKRRGIDVQIMQETYPKTYMYLKRFEKQLRARAAFHRYFTKKNARTGEIEESGPFYSMFDIGPYTFAHWKVVWPNMGDRLDAAVVSLQDGKVIVPQHIVSLVACESPEEAHYIAAAVNSVVFQFAARAYSQAGGKGFGTPQILDNLCIPYFDTQNPLHRRLSQLSREAHQLATRTNQTGLQAVESHIDEGAAELWDLTAAELEDVRLSLAELQWKPE